MAFWWQVFLSLREKLKSYLLDALKSCLQRKQAEPALVLWEVVWSRVANKCQKQYLNFSMPSPNFENVTYLKL